MPNNPNAKDNLKPFKKGQSGNPNGRPKNTLGVFSQQLKDEGYPPAKRHEIEETYLQLINLDIEKLEELRKDKTKPLLVQIAVKHILAGKGFDVVERMLDRSLGKAIQKSEVVTTEAPYIPSEDDLEDK